MSSALVRFTKDAYFVNRLQRSQDYLKPNILYYRRNLSGEIRTKFGSIWSSKHRKRDTVTTHGFLTSLFNKKSNDVKLPNAEDTEDLSEYDKLENEEEILLMETTKSDGTIASLFYRNGGSVDVIAINALCAKVNWPPRPVNKFIAALKNSYLVSSISLRASGTEEENDQLIAIARATSDHAFNATIWDVIVDPDYQGKGLGKCLIERMVRTLLRKEITNISLFADKHVVRFYEKLGFEADPGGIKGMFWYPPGFNV